MNNSHDSLQQMPDVSFASGIGDSSAHKGEDQPVVTRYKGSLYIVKNPGTKDGVNDGGQLISKPTKVAVKI